MGKDFPAGFLSSRSPVRNARSSLSCILKLASTSSPPQIFSPSSISALSSSSVHPRGSSVTSFTNLATTFSFLSRRRLRCLLLRFPRKLSTFSSQSARPGVRCTMVSASLARAGNSNSSVESEGRRSGQLQWRTLASPGRLLRHILKARWLNFQVCKCSLTLCPPGGSSGSGCPQSWTHGKAGARRQSAKTQMLIFTKKHILLFSIPVSFACM